MEQFVIIHHTLKMDADIFIKGLIVQLNKHHYG